MKERSHRRRTGAGLLAALALYALTQALVSVELPNSSQQSALTKLKPVTSPSNAIIRAPEPPSGRPGRTETRPMEIVPAGRPSVHVPILMYHYIRVNPDERDAVGVNLSVTPADFRSQMDWLARNGYHPIDLDDLRGYLLSGASLPAKPVVITLDDGYRDLYTEAYPVLRTHRFKAVAYIVSGFLGRPSNVTSNQVVEMNANGIEVGSHTVSHEDLIKTSGTELHRQVADSKAALEELLGHAVPDFCYPSGAVNPAVAQAVAAAGYQSATTTAEGTVHSAADRYLWTRVRVTGGESLGDFVAKLGGVESSVVAPGRTDAPALSAGPPLRPPLTHGQAGLTVPQSGPTAGALTP
jgi:peptidoglycan/xylan/chitin deacetylase (PgdA/CDA1 family)